MSVIIGRILTFCLPLPVVPILLVILAGWGLMKLDAAADIRAAVKDYAEEVVAGATIARLEAEAATERDLRRATQRRAVALQHTNTFLSRERERMAGDLAAIRSDFEEQQHDIDDLLAGDVSGDCTVGDLADRLRSR